MHEGFTKEDNERKMSEVSEKNERSLSEVLSEVLERDYWVKVKDIAMFIDYNGGITPGEARKVSGKSAATVRRYLKMLTNTGYVVSEGNTNNSVYKRNNK